MEQIIVYSYDPQGMAIFEMTIKQKGEKDGGGRHGASRELFI